MPSDSKFTKDGNGNVAVRVVSNDTSVSNSESMFTHDENGNVAVRVVGATGGGGGDQHNLGWYATQAALEEAHPTAEAGDWAIVGATDTVWVWDVDNSEWVDSDQKGQVTSVNGQTGVVTVSEVPDQTGNAGKFLTTDGTNASWSDKPLVNKATGTNSLTILGTANTAYTKSINIGVGSSVSQQSSVAIGESSSCGNHSVAVGQGADGASYGLAIGAGAKATGSAALFGSRTAIGNSAVSAASGAIQLSANVNTTTNSDANTFKVANGNGNFEIMSADGTIPTGRLTTLLEALYPVGSVYLGTQSTCPLATLLPNSTWALVAADKALWTGDGTNGNTTIAAALPNIKALLTIQDGAGASKKWAPGCTVSGAFTKENIARDAAVTGGATSYNDAFDLGINAHESNSIYDDNATTVQPPAYVVNVWRRTA